MFRRRAQLTAEFLTFWTGKASLVELGRLLDYTPRRLGTLIGPEARPRTRRPREAVTLPATTNGGPPGPMTVHDAITIMQAATLWGGIDVQGLACPIVDLRAYRRQPAPDTFATLLGACTRRQVVDVTYLAKTRQHSVLFSPHTLVLGAHRIHFRGYSAFEAQGGWHWWDLVPSRVTRAQLRPDSGFVGEEHDTEWHRRLDLLFLLRHDLTASVRASIRHEHGIIGDELLVRNVRGALSDYVANDFLSRRYDGVNGPAWCLRPDHSVASPANRELRH